MDSCFGLFGSYLEREGFASVAHWEMPVSDRSKAVWLILAVLMTFSTDLHAQTASARLRGVIRNATGAPVPNASIVAAGVNRGTQLVQTTDAQGRYLFPAMPPGEFTITVEAKGFRKRIYNHLTLDAEQAAEFDIVLQPGDPAGEPMTANATQQILLPDAQMSRTFTLFDIQLLPLLEVMPLHLAAFGQGVEVEGGNEGLSRINGTRQGSNNITLDGIDANDPVSPSLGLSLTANNANTVAQVREFTAGAKAEYGRNAGGQVVLVTRSGGSRWSGSAYEYFQNANLNANDYFTSALNGRRPQDNRNIFGVDLGGPVVKDRTTLFANYEGTRLRQQIFRNRTVLTSSAKQGLFQWLPPGSSTLQSFNIANNDPRKLGINPQVAQILNLMPLPNNGAVGDGINTAGFYFNNPIDATDDQATLRIDHSLKSNHRVFARFNWLRQDGTDWRHNADATFPGQPSGRDLERHWAFALGSDWAISDRTINELRAGSQSSSSSFTRPGRLSTPMMVSGLWTDPLNPDFPFSQGSTVVTVSDKLSLSRNQHSFKAGATFWYTDQNLSSAAGIYPDITFGTSYGNTPPAQTGSQFTTMTPADLNTFQLLYNDLLGRPETVTQTFYSNLQTFQTPGSPRVRDYSYAEVALFFQDDWRLRKNLSLSLGVRYELSTAPSEKNGLQGAFNQASSIDAASQLNNLSIQPGGSWFSKDLNNFAPRFGFAWTPEHHSTVTLRGGYALLYDRMVGATVNFVDANTPGYAQTVTTFPNQLSNDVRLGDSAVVLPVQPASPTVTQPDTRATSAGLFNSGLRTGYVHEFNLTVQKVLSPDTILEASYVGTRGVDLFMNVNLNQPRITGDFLTAFKQIQAFRSSLTPVPSSNTLVRMFGSVNAAVSAIGGSTFDQGLAGAAADTVDRLYYSKYASAGQTDFYLRNFPQFNQMIQGTNLGRSYYDSLQLRARHRMGQLQLNASYTWGKSLDNISVDGGSFTSPIDSFDVSRNKALSDADRTHVVTAAGTFLLPNARRTWLRDAPRWMIDTASGWELSMLGVWESGAPFTVSSGRQTFAAGVDSWANYFGPRNIGAPIRASNGVYYFYQEQLSAFSFPDAGEIGTAGRNTFRGPNYFNIDMALVKDVEFKNNRKVSLRLEAYNVFNRANFALPTVNLSSLPTFGQITSTVGTPRILQVSFRYVF